MKPYREIQFKITLLSLLSFVSCGIQPIVQNKVSSDDISEAKNVIEKTSKANDEKAEECADQKEHELTYFTDIAPIVEKHCLSCHYSSAAAGGWALDSFETLNPKNKEPADAWNDVLNSITSGRMPPNGDVVDKKDIGTLSKWLKNGAPKQNKVGCEKITEAPKNILPLCEEGKETQVASRLWRLTHSQWGHSTRSILGVEHNEEKEFTSDPALYGFDNFSEALRITELQANRYRVATRNLALATLSASKISQLRDLYSPGWREQSDKGREEFIRNLGHRLFRRPVSERQVSDLVKVQIEGKKKPTSVFAFL